LDRDALLARIIDEGDRRRRRRQATIGGGLAAVVLLLGVVVAWPGGDDDHERVDVADADAEVDDTTTTSTAATATTATTVVVTATTGTTIESTAAPEATATTPVTEPEPELVCRNSHDERCGPFYWDLPPGFVNQPITVSAAGEPLQATAGQPVDLSFATDDPDASGCVHQVRLGGGRMIGNTGPCAIPACGTSPRFGPWDPPAIEDVAPPDGGATVTAAFDAPGTYTITVDAGSWTMCGGADLYHSTATSSFTIEVAPAT
jgi:hypothetical protein